MKNRPMRTIKVPLKLNPYLIYFVKSPWSPLRTLLIKYGLTSQAIILTHPPLNRFYGVDLIKVLKKTVSKVILLELPEGEKTKSWDRAGWVFHKLLRNKIDKGGVVIILGGGVLGDLGGFVAATYRRGVPFINIPTTLLAQIDSSVGGKVGIDHPLGKNMIGAFYHPRFIINSPLFLKTLATREIRSGLAEIIKYAIIADERLFTFLENNIEGLLRLRPQVLEKAIARCCEIKAAIVAADEKEKSGLRTILNFGHTLGHALETVSHYKGITHGEGIAVGMTFAVKLSEKLGLCRGEVVSRVCQLLQRAGLPLQVSVQKYPFMKVFEAMQMDKKTYNGQFRLVLTRNIGHVIVCSNPPNDLVQLMLKECFFP